MVQFRLEEMTTRLMILGVSDYLPVLEIQTIGDGIESRSNIISLIC